MKDSGRLLWLATGMLLGAAGVWLAFGPGKQAQAGNDPERIREGMSGNLCRCGAYAGITEAVLEAQKTLDAAQ